MKLAIIRSSSDRVKARSQPASSAGAISGNVMTAKAFHGRAEIERGRKARASQIYYQLTTCDFGLFEVSIDYQSSMMRKSVHTKDYAIFLKLLIELRHKSGLTQAQLGQQLPIEQPGISKIERGERRIDIIELKMICERLGITLTNFVSKLQERLENKK